MQALKKSSAGFSDERTLGQETDFNPYSMSTIRNKISELRLEEDMHQPHPDDTLKLYVVKKVQEKLKAIL